MATTFERARRKRAYRRLAGVVRGLRGEAELLPLDEATRRLRPFHRRYVGLREIPVRQIVGTDGRDRDFDREFLPRRPDVGRRWRQVEQAFPEGSFPPIVAYRLGEAYFVIDGHHRVAIARQRGMERIDAEVTELRARWHLPADADVVELIHAEQERIFMEESGLAESRPEARIRFSRPVGYLELLENVQVHGYRLMLNEGRVFSRGEIATDWYERVYLPTVDAIRVADFEGFCADATFPDRFLWVHERRRELAPEFGLVAVDEIVRSAAGELKEARSHQLRRQIRRSRLSA